MAAHYTVERRPYGAWVLFPSRPLLFNNAGLDDVASRLVPQSAVPHLPDVQKGIRLRLGLRQPLLAQKCIDRPPSDLILLRIDRMKSNARAVHLYFLTS